MEKERVQELLDDFVVKNEQDINNVAVENPPLYDAFISALSLLSSKFGTSQEIKKLTEEEIEAKKPKKELPFKVGDVFMRGNLPQSMKGEEKDILYTILSIDESKSEVNYQVNFVKKGTSKLTYRKIETILEDIEVGNWVLIDKNENTSLASSSVQESTSNLSFKVGDKFNFKNRKSPIYTISKIDSDKVYVQWLTGTKISEVNYPVSDAVSNFNDGTWIKIKTTATTQPTTTSSPFKIGDVYYSDTFRQNLTITDVKVGKISVHYDAGIDAVYVVTYCNLMVEKKHWIKVTAPTSTKATAKGTRVSPSQHASQTAVGTVMTGNDGNEWIVVEDSRGVKKWQRNTAKATIKVVSDEEQELLDAIEGTKLLADTGDSDAKKELSLLKAQLKKLKAK
jgi:hypothetical protein